MVDYTVEDLSMVATPVENEVIEPEVISQTSVAEIVGKSSEEYANKVIDKITQASSLVPEIKTLGLTTDNLKKIFMGMGVLQLLIIAQKNKIAIAGLGAAYYVWKQNQKKEVAPMDGYYRKRR
ncbi:MAG: hypothetical protein COT84_01980 [Chlamydiae bacterium CG10_big_fil_rev_8_21_14_0_10_35_9]|nr:MAG: hypothetical protein COT84_01980 [Chlamydiae bacterium CG10_big_fil_rev_8_21_14_0_10_35_9]